MLGSTLVRQHYSYSEKYRRKLTTLQRPHDSILRNMMLTIKKIIFCQISGFEPVTLMYVERQIQIHVVSWVPAWILIEGVGASSWLVKIII